jgi:hypothetical protein
LIEQSDQRIGQDPARMGRAHHRRVAAGGQLLRDDRAGIIQENQLRFGPAAIDAEFHRGSLPCEG